MSTEIAVRYTDCVWNKKDLSVIDELVDQNILIHSLLGDFRGQSEMRTIVETWLTGFPDLHVTHLAVLSDQERVVIQWEARGIHQNTFKGIKPSGKTVFYPGVTIYRIQKNKIIEYWAYLDMDHLLNQLR